jgi:hypothetical protein
LVLFWLTEAMRCFLHGIRRFFLLAQKVNIQGGWRFCLKKVRRHNTRPKNLCLFHSYK